MLKLLVVILIVQSISPVLWGFLNPYPKIELETPDGDDPGKPLFLTPYVESGNITEGRRLARVSFTESLEIKSYAGFFTVNKQYDSNQFFWYFPPIVSSSKHSPVIVWLQGGPGASSLFGLFTGNGPLRVRNGKFESSRYTWALYHHIIYIDNPVGTGFSFTNDSKGYCTDEVQIGEQLYSTVTQFFKLFPELKKNKFFVTGESYGGKYVPALAHTIHKKNPTAEVKINLIGMAIGNGFTDPEHQIVYSKYLYQIGLIDFNQAKIFEEYEKKAIDYIKSKDYDKAFDTMDQLFSVSSTGGKSVFYNMTGYHFYFNYLHSYNYINTEFVKLVQTGKIRKAIHVGDLEFQNGLIVRKHLKHDIMQSVAPWMSELLDHYYCNIYSGQLDIIVPYPSTVNYLRNLNFSGAEEYKKARRFTWGVHDDLAGYVKYTGKVIEMLVRNAGHMANTDQPQWTLDLITRFTYLFGSAGSHLPFNPI